MTVAVDSMRADLAALVGASQVRSDAAAVAAWAVDGKVPDCAVSPASAEQVAAVLHYAGEHRLGLVPRGNGTKISMGNPPTRYDLALSLGELKRVVHYEPADLTISVEPGMTFGEFQNLVGQKGLWLPLDPRGGAEATIGGIIAANAAGPLRQGFGGPRDMVLGLKIAPTGKLPRRAAASAIWLCLGGILLVKISCCSAGCRYLEEEGAFMAQKFVLGLHSTQASD